MHDERQIRALFNDTSICVYQAFSHEIADAALKNNRFSPPFRLNRMTWIKPSFNWMMYRSGYATKPGQERILAVWILRTGFDWAVNNAVPTSYSTEHYASPDEWAEALKTSAVRIQWDPERNVDLSKDSLRRTIQIGLSGEAIQKYVAEWTVKIQDVTNMAREMNALLGSKLNLAQQPHLQGCP